MFQPDDPIEIILPSPHQGCYECGRVFRNPVDFRKHRKPLILGHKPGRPLRYACGTDEEIAEIGVDFYRSDTWSKDKSDSMKRGVLAGRQQTSPGDWVRSYRDCVSHKYRWE